MNVPGLSARTLERDIAASQFTTGANIQVCSSMEYLHIGTIVCDTKCCIVLYCTYVCRERYWIKL